MIVGHGAIIHATSVGESCAIGMGAILSLAVDVGAGTVVAEGAVVVQGGKIPPSVVVAGIPAKRLREVRETEKEVLEGRSRAVHGPCRKIPERGYEARRRALTLHQTNWLSLAASARVVVNY